MSFAKRLKEENAAPGTLNLYWLGQGGFALKTEKGKLVLIDPYFTDSVYQSFREENGYSFKRLSPSLLDPEDLTYDEIYISHEHGDHLDVEAYPAASQSVETEIFCNRESAVILKECGVESGKITEIETGDVLARDGFTVKIVKANHGEFCPGAKGFLFDFGFVRIYYSGDTCYDEELLSEIAGYKPDICLLPVNGAFGNMNNEEAVRFGEGVHGKILIPYHFWTFPLHLGDPLGLLQDFEENGDTRSIQLKLLTPGETFVVESM